MPIKAKLDIPMPRPRAAIADPVAAVPAVPKVAAFALTFVFESSG